MSEERIKTKVQMGILKPAHEVFEAIVNPDKMNTLLPQAPEKWKAVKHLMSIKMRIGIDCLVVTILLCVIRAD